MAVTMTILQIKEFEMCGDAQGWEIHAHTLSDNQTVNCGRCGLD